jgi:stress-induced morphogen|tara:strand:+ start:231 stop:461 length:231 start_codon:yes stop_codon:yes gene_type:complete
MPMSENLIKQFIMDAIPDCTVEIEDLKGDGDHYSAIVKSKSFSGKTRVEQHKMVYDAFKGKMGSELHALKLKTITE